MLYTDAWLEDAARIPITIIEVNVYDNLSPIFEGSDIASYGREVRLLFSSHAFTNSTGTFTCLPLIKEDIILSETLSKDGNTQISFGDISLDNINGELDNYLNFSRYIWANRPIKIYYGDLSWTQSISNQLQVPEVFLTIFDGIIGNIDSKNSKTLNIKIRDKLIRLDTPISENKLETYGGWLNGQTNKETLRPIAFGEVFNITPLLISGQFQQYMFSCNIAEQLNGIAQNGEAEQVFEIRDSGYLIWPIKPPKIFSGIEFRLTQKYRPQQPLTIILDETYTPPVQYYEE